MSTFRAWRFNHPDFDLGELAGFAVTAQGEVSMVEDDACVRQAILLLLTTRLGERVMRPNYGCDLNRLMFSSNDDNSAGLAVHYVRRALDRWEPRIEILRLDAHRSTQEPGQLDVVLDYRVLPTLTRDQLMFSIDLMQGVD